VESKPNSVSDPADDQPGLVEDGFSGSVGPKPGHTCTRKPTPPPDDHAALFGRLTFLLTDVIMLQPPTSLRLAAPATYSSGPAFGFSISK
jgi:hypothetical protein